MKRTSLLPTSLPSSILLLWVRQMKHTNASCSTSEINLRVKVLKRFSQPYARLSKHATIVKTASTQFCEIVSYWEFEIPQHKLPCLKNVILLYKHALTRVKLLKMLLPKGKICALMWSLKSRHVVTKALVNLDSLNLLQSHSTVNSVAIRTS